MKKSAIKYAIFCSICLALEAIAFSTHKSQDLRSSHRRVPGLSPSINTKSPRSITYLFSSSEENSGSSDSAKIYLDIEVADKPIGRLIFEIPNVNLLPLHTENIIKLCSQEQSSVDPRCKYTGCEFQYSPQFVESFAQYRWGHTLKGKGRNVVGRAEERITDPANMKKCTHSVYGGQYYGLNYIEDIPEQEVDGQDTRVVLTVPLVGPGRGSTDLCLVRVGESPVEWKERLLLNSAVLGWMDHSSTETLHAMARQTQGPPKVADSGVL